MDERVRDFLALNPSDRPFTYTPLPESGAFRTVSILPGNPDEALVLEISNQSFENPPRYDALSYTWGEPGRTSIIYVRCGQCDLPLTTSLAQALHRFRLSSASRTFWIDQCCIDQSNVAERSQQVNCMKRIYAAADMVYAWLGPGPTDMGCSVRDILLRIDTAIDTAASEAMGGTENLRVGISRDDLTSGSKLVMTIYDTGVFWNDRILESQGLPLSSDSRWEALETMLSSPYFSRLWIIQELRVSRDARVVWGETELPWSLIFNAVRFCLTNSLFLRPGSDGHSAINRIRSLMPFTVPRATSLTRFMFLTSSHKCTDERDRIFALLGLCSEIGDGYQERVLAEESPLVLRPDYTLTWRQVLVRTIRVICLNSKRLDVFFHIHHDAIPPPESIPSWAYCKGLYLRDQGLIPGMTNFVGNNACGGTVPKVLESSDENILCLKGYIVDRIVSVGEPISFITGHDKYQKGTPRSCDLEAAWKLVQEATIDGSGDIEPLQHGNALESRISALVQSIRCRGKPERSSSSGDDPRLTDLYSFATFQIRVALAGINVLRGKPEDQAVRAKIFYPEAGIEAAFRASEADGNLPRDFVQIPDDDMGRCRELVETIFLDSLYSSDIREEKIEELMKGLRIIRTKKPRPDYLNGFVYKLIVTQGRRVFVTATRNVGLAPAIASAGDEICILHGGPVPYLCRDKVPRTDVQRQPAQQKDEAADQFGALTDRWLLGACYLHAMMQGEALAGTDNAVTEAGYLRFV